MLTNLIVLIVGFKLEVGRHDLLNYIRCMSIKIFGYKHDNFLGGWDFFLYSKTLYKFWNVVAFVNFNSCIAWKMGQKCIAQKLYFRKGVRYMLQKKKVQILLRAKKGSKRLTLPNDCKPTRSRTLIFSAGSGESPYIPATTEGASCQGWWVGRWLLIIRVLRFYSFSTILTSEKCWFQIWRQKSSTFFNLTL